MKKRYIRFLQIIYNNNDVQDPRRMNQRDEISFYSSYNGVNCTMKGLMHVVTYGPSIVGFCTELIIAWNIITYSYVKRCRDIS